MKTRWLKAIPVLVALLLLPLLVIACGPKYPEPIIVEKEVVKEVIKEIVVEKEVIKEVPVEVVVIQEVVKVVEVEKVVVKEVLVPCGDEHAHADASTDTEEKPADVSDPPVDGADSGGG